jgi:hypothetical protein
VRWDVRQDERIELRGRLDDATNFMDGASTVESPSKTADESPKVAPETGSIYILTHPDSPRLPWQDPRSFTGVCPVREDEESAEDDSADRRCAFRSATFMADTRPDQLHSALYLDLLATQPDLPRRLLWRWVKQWKVVRIRLSQVRVADMTGKDAERFVPGGEPALRRSHENWGYVRWVHAEQRAALVKLESDPSGERVAHRMLFFSYAADALENFGAIQVTPVRIRAQWLPALDARGADGRRLLPRLLKRPVGRRTVFQRVYRRLVLATAGARERKASRRSRRQDLRRTVWAFLDNELRLDPRNPENRDPVVRAEARGLFIKTVKSALPSTRLVSTLAAATSFVVGGVTGLLERIARLFF